MAQTYKRYRVRMFVGPTAVQHYAERARTVGYTDIVEGTEHIHFNTSWLPVTDEPLTDRICQAQAIGERIYGEPMTAVWRQVEILRAL